MAATGRKSAYKRAYREVHNDGLRRPKNRPQVSTKYREEYRGYDYE